MQNMENYTIIIDHDPESGLFVAEVVELPGCTAKGTDIAALKKSIHEAIAAYAESKA
jgi:predicted RNase H-like HicB family nuclease